MAAGLVPIPAAIVVALLLATLALWVGYLAGAFVAIGILAYAAINTGYSLGLKHVPIIDVFLISAGFMLRILVGTVGVDIAPSHWLLLCGLMVTLFLGFSKRYAELMLVESTGATGRKVLDAYDRGALDKMITITATTTVITYGLYAVSPETVRTHGTDSLIYTVPFVLYGVMRYVFRLHHDASGEDTARTLLTDKHLIVTVVAWLATVLAILAR